jgi:hypothetical protein
MSIFTVPSCNNGIFLVPDCGAGGGGSGDPSWGHAWGYNGRVPGGSGLQALRPSQGQTAFQVGLYLPAGAELNYLTVSVNPLDAARDYVLELITDPTGAASVQASLALSAGQRQARVDGLSLVLGTDYGLQLRRTAGPVADSTFTAITALAGGLLP